MAKKAVNTGLSAKDKERIAFDLYVNTDKTQREICEIIGWSEQTFVKHKQTKDWEELKAASEITAQKIIRNLYQRLSEATEEGVKLDADKIIKLANSIEKLSDRRATVSNAINVFKEFTSWLMNEHPELAKQIITYQDQYVMLKING